MTFSFTRKLSFVRILESNFFLIIITPCKEIKSLKHKWLQGKEDLGTETLIMNKKSNQDS